ncbi:MAG: ABC transporter substrate-binding protein [Candidatus Eiseniibacteriota bacterium]
MAGGASLARAETVVTLAGWGGVTQDAVIGKLLAGADKLGITIKGERSGAWPGIKAHVLAGAPGWDVAEIGFARCEQAAQSGKLTKIDYGIVDKSQLPANLALPNYVGVFTFSYGIAYQKKKYGDNPPKSWADFYDTKKFPGRRSMIGEGLYAFESALIADGVAPKDVYTVLKAPGGVDRAFKKLETIKPDVAVWWRSTGQAMQLMRDGEVDMAIFPNGRALALVKDNIPIGFEWNQAFIDVECFMVPDTAKETKGAFQLINLALDPKNQATFAAAIGYGPVNPKAYEVGVLSPDQAAWLPTAPQNIGKQIYADQTWYASKEAEAAYLRFSKFLQQQ